MASFGTVTDKDRGYAALKRALARAGGDGIFGKAGIIGDKAASAHGGGEGHDETAGTNRDERGRFLPGSGKKTHHEAAEGELSNVDLALIHEFGIGVPERSFLRAAFDKNHPKYLEHLQKLVAAIYDGRITPERAMGLLSQEVASDVREFIRTGQVQPPDSAATIAKKGSSTTLIDSAQLINAIAGAVEKGRAPGEE